MELQYIVNDTVFGCKRFAVSDVSTRRTTFGFGIGQTVPADQVSVVPAYIVDYMTSGRA